MSKLNSLCERNQDFKPFHVAWNIMSIFISNSAEKLLSGNARKQVSCNHDHLAFLISFKDDKYPWNSPSRGYNPLGSHKVTVFMAPASGDKLLLRTPAPGISSFLSPLSKWPNSLIVKAEPLAATCRTGLGELMNTKCRLWQRIPFVLRYLCNPMLCVALGLWER